MPFTGKEGEQIDLKLGASWTKNYRDKNPGETKAHMYGREILQRILTQPKCVGIRFYYAIDDAGARQLVLIGVNEEGQDIESGIVAEKGITCPPNCFNDGVLNGK